MGNKLATPQPSAPGIFLLYEGGEVAESLRTNITRIRVAPHVTEIPNEAFYGCHRVVEVQLNEGLEIIGRYAFGKCSVVHVTTPSTVTNLGRGAFLQCSNLAKVQLNEGLQVIGESAFKDCAALQSVTIPSTVTKSGYQAFSGCSDLSEVIFLGGERLLNQEFLDRRLSVEDGILNQEVLKKVFGERPFEECQDLRSVKISISWALCERMERLPSECRASVLERIRGLPRLELRQDGSVLACFPLVGTDAVIKDTGHQTAWRVFQVLQLIAFHELKEFSILFELAMWKSRIGGATSVPRADCRVSVPDIVKSLIMEYCGFAGFLEPAIEGGRD